MCDSKGWGTVTGRGATCGGSDGGGREGEGRRGLDKVRYFVCRGFYDGGEKNSRGLAKCLF